MNITIQILPDSIPELDETFTLRLHNVSEVNQRLQQGSVSIFVSFFLTFLQHLGNVLLKVSITYFQGLNFKTFLC